MKIEFGVQPNCSECAFVIYKKGLDKNQKSFIDKFMKEKKLDFKITTQGNIIVESKYEGFPANKGDLWDLKEDFESLMNWEKIKPIECDNIRDESYDELIEEGKI